MTQNSDLPRGVFFEKSLGDILKTYTAVFEGQANWPFRHFIWSILFFYAFGYILIRLGLDADRAVSIADASVRFALAYGSVGFGVLLAGFSLVAATIDHELFEAMSQIPYKKTNLPFVNVVFSIFIYAIFVFFLLFLVSFAFFVFISRDSFFSLIVWNPQFVDYNVTLSLILVYLVLLMSFIVYSLSALKSLIFNLHQTLLLLGQARVDIGRMLSEKE